MGRKKLIPGRMGRETGKNIQFPISREVKREKNYPFHGRLSQSALKCGNVATLLRGTTSFARHKMVNVNDKKAFFLYRRDKCLFMSLDVNFT